jgi:hypothetical protein
VVVEPVPLAPERFDSLLCLSRQNPIAQCGFNTRAGPTRFEGFLRSQATSSTFVVDLDAVVCPKLPRCDAVVDRVITRRDATHVTATFARSIWKQIDAIFARDALFD